MSEYNRTIIAIGRQFGSGGREIGEKLAKELGIPFYDKELIALAGQRSGIDQSLLDDVDENATNSMLYSLVAGSYTPPNGFTAFPEESMTDKRSALWYANWRKKAPAYWLGAAATISCVTIPTALKFLSMPRWKRG